VGFAITATLFSVFAFMVDRSNPVLLDRLVFHTGTLALACPFALFAFGGIARPVQRWIYLQSPETKLMLRRVTLRQRFTTYWDRQFWRWWFHIDAAGNDRDA
jgi:amino acid permease